MVMVLLEKGMNIDAEDKDEWTALHKTVAYEHEAVVKLLVEKVTDVELVLALFGQETVANW